MSRLTAFLRRPAIILAILLLVVLGVLGFVAYQYQGLRSEVAKNGNQAQDKETKDLISEVGKLIDLPSGIPTVATVKDINKLKTQPFFAKAKNGDKILIYASEKKAILYRPSENKIINVAPVNLGTTTPAAGTPTPTSGVTPQLTPTVTQAQQ